MTIMYLRSSLLCFVAPSAVFGFPSYANQIPNGQSVPHPGPQGGIWAGVGHVNAAGGGDRNPFGLDFAANGYQWTTTLCETDSDSDGRSNGVELGDPACQWFTGGPDPAGPALSHPGVPDEPKTTAVQDSCDDYIEPSVTLPMDVAFGTPNLLDETQTHYRCQQKVMKVPSSEVLHLIKTEVLLDNPEVLHHMFIFLCPEGSSDGDRVGEGNYECSGQESKCNRIGGWAIGPHETCLPSNVGQELNFMGVEHVTVKIEAHYDNTSGQNQQDRSGIRATLTSELRPLKAAGTILGMATRNNDFEIPPQASQHALTNVCPSEATIDLPHPIYVYSFYPHMHLYGRSLYTEHYRCGQKIGEIGRIDDYEFDNQQSYELPTPIKILPGDAFWTVCEYNTMAANDPIYGGEETTDEMCLNFLSYYPRIENDDGTSTENFGVCMTFENGIQASVEASVELQVPIPEGFRFGLVGTQPSRESLLLDFDSNPANSWAPCCETSSCDALFLADKGGICAEHSDCVEGLNCDSGFCVFDISAPAPTYLPDNDPSNQHDYDMMSNIPSPAPVSSDVSIDIPASAVGTNAPSFVIFLMTMMAVVMVHGFWW